MSMSLPPLNLAADNHRAPPRRAGSAPPAQAPGEQVIAPPVLQQQQEDLRYQQEIASIIRTRTFRDFRFRLNNYFEYNRRGLVPEYQILRQLPWDQALIDPTKALVPYEARAAPRDWDSLYNDPFGRDDEAIRAQQAENMVPFKPPEAGFVRPKHDTGDAFVIGLRDWLRDQGLDIRSLRHLGAGGTGLATLFEVRSSRSRVRKKFVVKSSRRANDPLLQYEKSIQMNLRRAPHIVRTLLWADDILTGAPLTEGTRLFCQQMDDQDLIYLEVMKGGNLSHMIGKVVAAEAMFPNGVLWNVFFCLVRACINMEYPPRLQIQENGDWFWDSETGEDGMERVPDQEYQKQGYGLVHFDLDPSNVMIGDYDARHPAVPVFKAGDFSHSSVPRNPTFATRDQVWGMRKAGKRTHQLPEQFHKEWEYVRNLPQDEFPVPKVAGNYGPTSNIWAIGMVLHDMITRNKPPDPPAAFGPMNGLDASLMPDSIPTFRDVNGTTVDPFYTHGSWLRNAQTIDNDLKGLLIRCLADQPAHRPTLQELTAWMDKADRILAWNDDPDDREWFEQLVNEAPDAIEMVDPLLDLMPDQVSGLPAASRLSFLPGVLRMWTWLFGAKTSRTSQAPQAPQGPQDPQVLQDGLQGNVTRISNLSNTAGVSLQTLSGARSNANPPQPERDDRAPSNNSAWLFNVNMDQLVLNVLGVALANPMPDAALNPAPDVGERAADRLPLSTPVRPTAGPGRRLGSWAGQNGAATPSPFGTLLSSSTTTNRTSMGSRSNTYLSGNPSSSATSVDDAPDTFLTAQDLAALGGNGVPTGIPRGVVITMSEGLSGRDIIPIPPFPPGTAPPAPPRGYLYGRASPSPPLDGQIVPAGMFTLRIDRADPARGGVPNIFYRDLTIGGGVAKVRDNNVGENDPDDGGRPGLPPPDEGGPWLPKVEAVRIPPYGLFERPPQRPRGYYYGRRLYMSPAEIQVLADRGIRAPPGRRIIRLVHVPEPEGDDYERPTIFYQIEPRARAPRPPSDDDPEPNILYCTLPIL